jgi:hypothetical protein
VLALVADLTEVVYQPCLIISHDIERANLSALEAPASFDFDRPQFLLLFYLIGFCLHGI